MAGPYMARKGVPHLVSVVRCESIGGVKPSEFKEVEKYRHLRAFLSRHFDMQVGDVRCLLQLPMKEHGLDAGCNFAAVNILADLLAGSSVLFYCPSLEGLSTPGDRGKRFKRLVEDFFPSKPLGPSDTAEALYSIVRNPLTHALGVGSEQVLVRKDRLTSGQIDELEENGKKPTWCPAPVQREGSAYIVDARGFYWGFHRMLHNLFAAPQHAGLADRLAAQIGFA
jgi:hypothetical protein